MLSSNTLMTCDELSNVELVRVPIRYALRTCARAVIGHAAALPSSGMNSRRFIRSPNRGGLCRTCGRKHSTRHCQLEVAALRDFNPVYVSSGSFSPGRGWQHVPACQLFPESGSQIRISASALTSRGG